MSLEGTVHCDGPDCERHAHVSAVRMDADDLPPGWLSVTHHDDPIDVLAQFCGWDCVLRYAGTMEPEEIVR